ncbi:Histone acetyltransferase [Aphelenchoides besseyi]|nr:Histone acetyltransferase [Aphelenchoides besseyi]
MPSHSRRSTLDDPGHVHIPKVRYRSRNEELAVDDYVYVFYTTPDGNNLELPATIVDIRYIESADGEQTQYYVHYADKDRRLDEWIDRTKISESLPSALSTPTFPLNGSECQQPLTRSQRRFREEFSHKQKSYEEMDATTAKLEKMHEERTKIKNVQKAVIGKWEMDVWYYSPYPVDIVPPTTDFLYICEFCLFYYTDVFKYKKHIQTGCKRRQPPGECIYTHDNLAVYEVYGSVYKLYSQCLCLLSKLFLDHKTLYYEVDNFRFYVLCELDEDGAHIVGHFSKEYNTNNNLACIMVLPPYQRRGYGKLLIQLSYAIAKREGRIGTPEKPLSDLGKVSYRSYWWWYLFTVLDEHNIDRNISVTELSELSGIHRADIKETFQAVKMVKDYKITGCDDMIICSRSIIDHCKTLQMFKAPKIRLNENLLEWLPDKQTKIVIKRESSSSESDNTMDFENISVSRSRRSSTHTSVPQ